jgi:hypothetical protein
MQLCKYIASKKAHPKTRVAVLRLTALLGKMRNMTAKNKRNAFKQALRIVISHHIDCLKFTIEKYAEIQAQMLFSTQPTPTEAGKKILTSLFFLSLNQTSIAIFFNQSFTERISRYKE